MENEEPEREAEPTRRYAYIFELGLGVAALGLGWLFGWSPAASLRPDSFEALATQAAIGLAATIPLLVLLWWADRSSWPAIADIRRATRNLVRRLLVGASPLELAMLALAAGLGEELLFRGLIQDGLAAAIGHPWGPVAGLLAGAIAFGLCHFVSPAYALLAFFAGVYLGGLFWWTDQLLAPVVTHATYDFIALLYYTRPGDQVD